MTSNLDDRIMSDFEWPDIPYNYPALSDEFLSYDMPTHIMNENLTYGVLSTKGFKICDIIYDKRVFELFLYKSDRTAIFVAPDKYLECFFSLHLSIRHVIEYHFGQNSFEHDDLYDIPMSQITSFSTIIVE